MPVSLDEVVELLRVKIRYHIGADMHELDLVEEVIDSHRAGDLHRHIAGIHDFSHLAVLISGCGRHHENRLHPVLDEAFDYTVAGRSQSSCNVRGELPSEHKYSHLDSSLYLFINLSTLMSEAVLIAEEMAPCAS